MKHIKTFEKYTPTMSKFNKMVSKNPIWSKYTDSDFNYKIGDIIKILNQSKSMNHECNIYEIINRFKDKYGTDRYRLRNTKYPNYRMGEFWQVETNTLGKPQFEKLSKEELEEYELEKITSKFNL